MAVLSDAERYEVWVKLMQHLPPGTPTTLTQALAWPRTGVIDCHGRAVDPLTVPLDVQRATASYALALLSDTSQGSTGVAAGTVKRTQLGDTSVEYFQPGTTQTQRTSPVTHVPHEVAQMLTCLGSTLRRGLSIPLLRT